MAAHLEVCLYAPMPCPRSALSQTLYNKALKSTKTSVPTSSFHASTPHWDAPMLPHGVRSLDMSRILRYIFILLLQSLCWAARSFTKENGWDEISVQAEATNMHFKITKLQTIEEKNHKATEKLKQQSALLRKLEEQSATFKTKVQEQTAVFKTKLQQADFSIQHHAATTATGSYKSRLQHCNPPYQVFWTQSIWGRYFEATELWR